MWSAFDMDVPRITKQGLSPIIFLHGRMDTRKTWRRFLVKIGNITGRVVYALDARNHGNSSCIDIMNFDVLASDLEEFMRNFAIPPAVLIGHGLGGRTAITLALKKPKLVEKLVVEDMTMKNYSSLARQSVQEILHMFKASFSVIPPEADEDTAKKAVIEFIEAQLPKARAQVKDSRLFELHTLPLTKVGDSYAWEGNLDVSEDMLMTEKCDQQFSGVYNGEALFLYGTDSFFDVLCDESIKKHFPAARKVPVEGAGHFIHHDFPDEFLNHVVSFLCP